MTHLLLTFLILVLAGLGLALGTLLRGRPLARGCDGAAEGAGCGGGAEGGAEADATGVPRCGAANVCPRGREGT